MRLSSMIRSISALLIVLGLAALVPAPALATNNNYIPILSDSDVANILSRPDLAVRSVYSLTDDAGNSMDSISVIQLAGQPYKYAAVYHTCTDTDPSAAVACRYIVNLAVSNDLISWHSLGLLVDNASMPKISGVSGSNWIVVTHEKWFGRPDASTKPARVAFELFYDFSDLLAKRIRATRTMGSFNSQLNGTPSFYELHLAQYGSWYSVDGQYGFHYWDGTRDTQAVTTIQKMFDPTTAMLNFPSSATQYSNRFIAVGATGNIGQRDTLITASARYNIQEANMGTPGASWDKWRLWLYKMGDSNAYPTGNGTLTQIVPQNPYGLTSFGNPSIAIVDRPEGGGKALVVSYFAFAYPGGPPDHTGTLLYYFNI